MKRPRPLRLVIALLAVLACVYGAARWRVDQMKWEAQQSEFLDGQFSGARGQGRSVLLTLERGSRVLTGDGKLFRSPQLLRVGSEFMVGDDHYPAYYTITSIEPEGVVIHFDIAGHTWAKGSVRLPWK